MFKSLTVLFVLGLVLGLWIGFNPQAHDKVFQSWTEAPRLFTAVKATVSDTMHNWTMSLKANEQIDSQKIMIVWKQASSILPTIWDNAHRMWLEIISGLCNTNTKK